MIIYRRSSAAIGRSNDEEAPKKIAKEYFVEGGSGGGGGGSTGDGGCVRVDCLVTEIARAANAQPATPVIPSVYCRHLYLLNGVTSLMTMVVCAADATAAADCCYVACP